MYPIYAVQTTTRYGSKTPSEVPYFSTRELARKFLSGVRKEIVSRNVNITVDNQDKFEFYYSWEEITVSWYIIGLTVMDNESEVVSSKT